MALPDLPTSQRGINRLAEDRWRVAEQEGRWWRWREKSGGGIEYHASVLPSRAKAKLLLDFAKTEAVAEREAEIAELKRGEIWEWYDRNPGKKKDEAMRRLLVLDAWCKLVEFGMTRDVAASMIKAKHNVPVSTLYQWESLTHNVPRCDWLPYLMPRHAGRTDKSDCSPEAWEFLKADYLRLERPSLEACYRRLTSVAAEQGWIVPSIRTMRRRIDALSKPRLVLEREGKDALKKMYPAQKRDRGVFHALQAVNADGHKWDVFVRWPGESTPIRPQMCAFQDLYSGKILSWRVDKTLHADLVRLAFGDIVEQLGIPDECYLDNGREFASKLITGGTKNRYRFKVKAEEPDGIMTAMGTRVHWTTPYAGQSKPIERAFGDFARDLAKHPKFAGAWTGNTIDAKPENYASAAVPLDVFLAVLAEGVIEHNARIGRRASVCGGRSFDETFAESYAKSPIRKATAQQARMCFLAAEGVLASRTDGSVMLMGNRYWGEFLSEVRGQRVLLRFDPDALQAGVFVFRLDNFYLGTAACVEAVGFNDVAAARAHARQRRAWMRGHKAMADAERTMSIQDVAALLPCVEAPPPAPEPKVVRLFHGAAALNVKTEEEIEEETRSIDDRINHAMALARKGGLRLVDDD